VDERSDATDWRFILVVTGTVAVLLVVIGAVLWLKGPLETECGGFSCGVGSSVSSAPGP
jgi:hypothetical protein